MFCFVNMLCVKSNSLSLLVVVSAKFSAIESSAFVRMHIAASLIVLALVDWFCHIYDYQYYLTFAPAVAISMFTV